MTTFLTLQDLTSHLREQYNCPDLQTIDWELCPEEFTGDLTVNCFRLAPVFRDAPPKIAANVGDFLREHPDVQEVEVIKAFVNITLTPAALFRDTVACDQFPFEAVSLSQQECRRVVVEFSAPNTNKPQHLGHVRNNSLGAAVTGILRKAGHTPYAVNLVNDRGIHICQSMLAYQRWSNGETPESAGKKGDHLVGDYYVMFAREQKRQLDDLREDNPAVQDRPDEELLLQTEIGRAAQDMLVAWEQGDEEVLHLWRTMNRWVLDGFEQTYERMGIAFDRVYLESETYAHGREIVDNGLSEGVFQRREDGAVDCDLSDHKLGSKVVLRSDGTSVYVTQDLGTTLIKQNDFQPDAQVWVVGDEQNYHFQVLFAILQKLGYTWAQNLYHLAYGMVNLPEGRMKSREGQVVDADDLADEMIALAREATLERSGGSPPDDLEERARVIGMGALKFMLLQVKPRTTMTFDPRAAIRFEGDTGPYVQYAYARISSILRKADDNLLSDSDPAWERLHTDVEKQLALRCARYPDMVQRAAEELDPSQLAVYLLELAKAFNQFYRECSVLGAEDEKTSKARLLLSAKVRNIIADGLEALSVGTLEQM